MKLFSFLVLFGIVNVSFSEMEYKREVVITNDLIKKAFDMNDRVVKGKKIANGLEHVIKTVVFKDSYLLGFLNHMFVLPERPYDADVPSTIQLHRTLKKIIKDELGIAAIEVPLQDFTNLTWKQLGDNRRLLTRIALRNIITKEIGDESKLLKKRKGLGEPSFNDEFSTLSINETTGHNSFDLNEAPTNDNSELIEKRHGDFYDEKSVPSSSERGLSNPLKKRKDFMTPSLNDDFSTLSIHETTGHNSFGLSDDRAKAKWELTEEGHGDWYLIDHNECHDGGKSLLSSKIFEKHKGMIGGQPSNRNTHDAPIKVMCIFIALFLNTSCPKLVLYALPDTSDNPICTIEKKESMCAKPEVFVFWKNEGTWSQELIKLLNHE